jgi:hypothetical protein
VLIAIDGESAFADPQAAITWSQRVKTDVNLKTLVDRGSGETLQLAFVRQRLAAAAPALRGRRGIRLPARAAPRARSAICSTTVAAPRIGGRRGYHRYTTRNLQHWGPHRDAQDRSR